MLTQAPVEPLAGAMSSMPNQEPSELSSSSLSFEDEKALLEVFTFLASTSNDPAKVAALCFENIREPHGAGYVIRLASNHGDLVPVKKGLEDIISISNKSSTHCPSESNNPPPSIVPEYTALHASALDDLLRTIVNSNFNRILCRLRSRHAKMACNFKKEKMKRVPIVIQVVTAFKERNEPTMCVLKPQITRLNNLFSQLEACSPAEITKRTEITIGTVLNIIKLFHKIWQDQHFRASFEHHPLSPTLQKLARYTSAACYLISDMTIRPFLTSMRVQIVKMLPNSIPLFQPSPDSLLHFANRLPVSPKAHDSLYAPS